ncbi:MAG TPA: hypothetical protein VGC00_15550 [Thermoanaerobaculia bacterium]|jgi:hypothetical protein
MKKVLSLCLLALVAAVVVVACSDGATSTPASPTVDNAANVTNVTDARRNATPVLLCHHQKGDTPAWVVIEVDNSASQVNRHLRHGDFTTGTCDGGLGGFEVGDNCTCCVAGGVSCGTI